LTISGGNRAWNDPKHRLPFLDPLGDFPTIDQVSHKYNLNEKQHHSFEEHAFRLLQFYCNTDVSGTSRLKQRCAILAGLQIPDYLIHILQDLLELESQELYWQSKPLLDCGNSQILLLSPHLHMPPQTMQRDKLCTLHSISQQ